MKDINANEILGVLTPTEKAIYKLRYLYRGAGYTQFKMSKFEEYELYSKNKDFLISENIITFRDDGGKLLALKPDVTLSIIKNTTITSGISKLCYNENVYRAQDSSSMKEITQVGLECLGDVNDNTLCEVLLLAEESLEEFSENCLIEVSDLDILEGLFDYYSISSGAKSEIADAISHKNESEVYNIAMAEGIGSDGAAVLASLATVSGSPSDVKAELNKFKLTSALSQSVEHFISLLSDVESKIKKGSLIVDFSVIGNMKYYCGIAFRGYIDTLPTSILSGGQYDKLLARMKKNIRGVGFAVYLNDLGKLPE